MTNQFIQFGQLVESLTVTPERYTKPVRIYCDVDGVLLPFFRLGDSNEPDSYIDTKIITPYREEKQTRLFFNQNAVDFLSKISQVADFVWLTSWCEQAPMIFDKALNIKSVGFLNWEQKFSDYEQVFKSVAIREDQKDSPSKFIWIDDMANRRVDENFTKNGFLLGDRQRSQNIIETDRFLSINTDSSLGITQENINTVTSWMQLDK